jgi:Immunoglobulin I-set domain
VCAVDFCSSFAELRRWKLNVTAPAASDAPAITTQPSNASVNVGQTASFTVVASGSTPLTYQWQKNASAIAGATSATYTTPATAMSDDGSQFKVLVSNSAGSATSNPATLNVSAASVCPRLRSNRRMRA